MASEKTTSKVQAWFCTTGIPSDVVIDVDNMTFHLHKFPLMSKSEKLHDLIKEQETNDTKIQRPDTDPEQEEIAEEECHITLPDFPGSCEAFEAAAKFCYGVKVELTPASAAYLRCAAEVLGMTEDYSEDNLVSRTERYFSQTVLNSVKYSIQALRACEPLLPLAETLGIVDRCIDAVAARASTADPSLFGWPVNETAGESGGRRRNSRTAAAAGVDFWFDELALLSLPMFQRLISAMKDRDMSPEIIENCLICYAKRYIPGISRSTRKPSSLSVTSENEQRELLETIIANMPPEKSSRSTSATRFLFGLLRTANILNVSEACRAALERKIGSELEQATLDDLLIPSYSYLNETLYDIDCVERILRYFMEGLEERSAAGIEAEEENSGVRSAALMLVGKLIDCYLSEIASDANLKPDKFYVLAVSLPEHARLFDDGLYRAVDVYLKAHPWISEVERERICSVMDCQKLTLEACTHAAQNDRLPLRMVIQVLFFEQLQLRQAIAGTLVSADIGPADELRLSNNVRMEEQQDRGAAATEEDAAAVAQPLGQIINGGATWRGAVRDNQMMRLDMDSMRTRVHELERECTSMKRVIEKIDKVGPTGGWLSKKFGCKLKTQVCDSHEPTVVEARTGRSQNRH